MSYARCRRRAIAACALSACWVATVAPSGPWWSSQSSSPARAPPASRKRTASSATRSAGSSSTRWAWPERVSGLRTRLQKARVLVVGDAMLDRYLFGDVERISPEAPVPVVKVTREEARLGGAANVALNVKSLGAHATLLTVVGNDE